jgi:hypothetical protein
MPGLIDYTGATNKNGLFVERMASRYPLRWHVRCTRCQSNWDADHRQIPYLTCRNTNCGRTPLGPRATLAEIGQAVTAVRSRDSESIRQYERQQIEKPVRWAEHTPETLASADPDSLRRFLDYLEGQ